jgi:hypothetical protein
MPTKSARSTGAAALLLLVATTSCAVDGVARPAPNIKPRPLAGDTVKQVLLSREELSKALGQTLTAESGSSDRFGGRNLLFEMHASPPECNGVVFELQKTAYGSANIRNVGRATWSDTGHAPAKVISVSETVVALAQTHDADALFADFATQWKRCEGQTVTDYVAGGQRLSTAAISDVKAADSVLSATVTARSTTTLTRGRALGVAANCLVEAEVTFFGNQADNTAADLAHRLMDKVSALS